MAEGANLLQLQNGSKSYGSRQLFVNATFAVNENEHVGVIGPNGAGKTTLFKVLLGEENLDHGNIVKSRQLSLGYLSQHDHWNPDETGNEYLERTCRIPVWDVKSRGILLQVTEDILEQKVVSLSGGYRMRIKLLGLLGQDPNLMLLDEPTNYLDLETTLLLEKFLQNYDGAFLLISHDREFLRRTTDHILEVEQGEMTKYNGNIDDYFEQKELLRTQLASRAQSQAEKRKTILDFVARFGAKATKAKQAQSRLKTLAKMETIEIKALPVSAVVRIPPPIQTGKVVLRIEDASFGYGTKKILTDVSLQVMRGDHVAVVGMNGAGKSTLLKGISGTMEPLSGFFEYGREVEVAFFAQHVVEALDHSDTVMQSLSKAAHKDVLPQDVLDLAGSLLFSGDAVKKKVSVLSGGEKSRVALGRVLLKKAPCLILDEPTNHLDFQTVEALTVALQKYPGTVIVVSHDRGFIRRVGTKILEVDRGKVHLYLGSYDEYVWNLEKRLADEPAEVAPKPKKEVKAVPVEVKAPESKNYKEAKKEIDKKLRALERKVQEYESEMVKLIRENEDLNDQIAKLSEPSMELIKKMSDNGLRIHELEGLWLKASEEKERL